jgi:S1-C subfamily serine protease
MGGRVRGGIIDENGTIVTNNQVVEGARRVVRVQAIRRKAYPHRIR